MLFTVTYKYGCVNVLLFKNINSKNKTDAYDEMKCQTQKKSYKYIYFISYLSNHIKDTVEFTFY